MYYFLNARAMRHASAGRQNSGNRTGDGDTTILPRLPLCLGLVLCLDPPLPIDQHLSTPSNPYSQAIHTMARSKITRPKNVGRGSNAPTLSSAAQRKPSAPPRRRRMRPGKWCIDEIMECIYVLKMKFSTEFQHCLGSLLILFYLPATSFFRTKGSERNSQIPKQYRTLVETATFCSFSP